MKNTLLSISAIALTLAATLGDAMPITQHLALIAKADPNQKLSQATSSHYKSFSPPQISNGAVVFEGKTLSDKTGVYSNIAGYLQVVANTNTAVPLGEGNFTSFSNVSSANNKNSRHVTSINFGKIGLLGTDTQWNTAIYNFTVKTDLGLTVNQKTPIPDGKGNFIGFAYPTVLADGGVAFWGKGQNDQEGLYQTSNKGLLTKLVDTNTTIPKGEGMFQHFSDLVTGSNKKMPGAFAFIGTGSRKQIGIFIAHHREITLIANNQLKIPGENVGYFTHFSDLSYDSNNDELSFIGFGILGQQGIFYFKNGNIVSAVTQRDVPPSKLGKFETFAHPNIQGDYIVFQASGAYKLEGIFLYKTDGAVYKILSNRDAINGKKILRLSISNHAFDKNQMAVLVQFVDGSSGIYVVRLNLP